MNDEVLRMYKQDLVAAVQEAVAPLVAENTRLAAELVAANTKIDKMLGYHVDDHNRIAALEAALTQIRNTDWSNKAAPTLVGITAMNALGENWYHGSESETLVDLKDPHNAHHPDRLKGPGLTAQETPVQIPCSCGPGDCNQRILAHNEYCTEDRARAGLAQETFAELDVPCPKCGASGGVDHCVCPKETKDVKGGELTQCDGEDSYEV